MAKIKISLSTEIRNGSIPANNIILYIQLHDIVFDYTNSIIAIINIFFIMQAKISMTVRGIMFTAQVISVATFFHYALKHIWHCQAYGKVPQ